MPYPHTIVAIWWTAQVLGEPLAMVDSSICGRTDCWKAVHEVLDAKGSVTCCCKGSLKKAVVSLPACFCWQLKLGFLYSFLAFCVDQHLSDSTQTIHPQDILWVQCLIVYSKFIGSFTQFAGVPAHSRSVLWLGFSGTAITHAHRSHGSFACNVPLIM